MNKCLCLSVSLLLICAITSAQNKIYTYYFDKDSQPVDSAAAVLYARGTRTDAVFTLYYYLKSTNLLLGVLQFADSTLNILEGSSTVFYENGNIRSIKNYKNNLLDGFSIEYDQQGRSKDSIEYEGNKKVFESHYSYHEQGHTSIIKRENFRSKIVEQYRIDTSGILRDEVFFDGKKGFHKVFDGKGALMSEDNITSIKDTDAEFPGGRIAWKNYLERTIDLKPLMKRGILPGTYTVNVKFIVNTDGSLQDFSVIRSDIGYGLEEEAIRIMRNSPRWTPAKQFGETVKAYKIQPIIFSITP